MSLEILEVFQMHYNGEYIIEKQLVNGQEMRVVDMSCVSVPVMASYQALLKFLELEDYEYAGMEQVAKLVPEPLKPLVLKMQSTISDEYMRVRKLLCDEYLDEEAINNKKTNLDQVEMQKLNNKYKNKNC